MITAESHLLKPETPHDYALIAGIFIAAAFLIAAIGVWGVRSLARVPNWQLHASIYVMNIGLGVAFCCGAAIYCINRARPQPDTKAGDFRTRLLCMMRTLSIECAGLLLALVQLLATAMAVLIVGMYIFGYPMPSPHSIGLLIKHWL
jgi:hypothetical protein